MTSISPDSTLDPVFNALATRALAKRALRAINLVQLRELHEHDGVLVRLAYNVEQAWLAKRPALVIELCELIEGCCSRAAMLEGDPKRTVFFRDTARHAAR